jgi:release factor glutamine methyltransferase
VEPDALLEELAATVGSRREAGWLLEEVQSLAEPARTDRARTLAARRAAGEPLQYVVGHWPFRDVDLLVDARALIPRPETELLVGLALERLAALGRPGVACDLGCGTGAIALSLAVEAAARRLEVQLVATDVDDAALALAGRNVARVGARGVELRCGSWYEALPVSLRGRVDLLCANPPYVAHAARASLAAELGYEPDGALFADDGTDGTPGLAAVEAVVRGAAAWLTPGGTLLVEHGAGQRAAVTALASASGLVDLVDHDDLGGRPRILDARRPA